MGFIAELSQGGGCDYTIECGTKVISLRASSMQEAERELEALLRGDGDEPSRYEGLNSAVIYEVGATSSVPVREIYARVAAEKKAARETQDKAARKELLKRLAKEFENDEDDEE